jgi:hypothetical protein
VTVDELAQSYAARPLAEDVEREVTVTVPPTVPGAPATATAAAGDRSATVTWQPPPPTGAARSPATP